MQNKNLFFSLFGEKNKIKIVMEQTTVNKVAELYKRKSDLLRELSELVDNEYTFEIGRTRKEIKIKKIMKQQIKELIQQHKQAKEEVWGCLNELSQLDEDKMSKEEFDTLEKVKLKYIEEKCWRSVFISQLEDLL